MRRYVKILLLLLTILLGSPCDLSANNGKEKKKYLLDKPTEGLFIATEIWRTLDDFSAGAVCLVLASELYDPEDYLYEYDEFLEYVNNKKD